MKFLLLGLFLTLSGTILVYSQETEVKTDTATTSQPKLQVRDTTITPEDISAIQARLDKLSIEISSITETTVLLAKYYVALSEKINELIQRYDELINLIVTSEPEENIKTTATSSTEDASIAGSQYVRFKVKDKGQEMEVSLDPSYVDMSVEFKRKISEENISTGTPSPAMSQQKLQTKSEQKMSQDEKEELMKHIETSLKSLQKKQDVTQEIPKDVLDDLFTAQRLFYKKRYTEALKVVQRSLAKQETAIGYSIEGSLYFVIGDIDAAVSSWNKALELDPNMEDVREALYKYARSRLRR
ncbi:MAG: tetratricopeptide repeat protein [Elusimicrobiota bacterium]|nr:tetratricopeptide repeat protein [Elusimicrobiota bacterium]